MDLVQASPVTTAEQLLALDEPGFRHELVRGELRRMTGAGGWHSAVALRIGRLLGNHVEQHASGHVTGADGGYLLERNPDTVRVPDTAFVSIARLPVMPKRGHIAAAPDFAVEVTSPNDTFADVHEKALFWIEHGSRLVWVVEPIARTVTIYTPNGKLRVAHGDDLLDGGDVLPGFTVHVRDLFPG